MGDFWTFLTYLNSLAGPTLMLLYPLGASFIYERFVREQLRKHGVKLMGSHPSPKKVTVLHESPPPSTQAIKSSH
ncbi:hypothetical protein C4D60_Mb10t22560 [Musa balbisiana]|uniref:Uncharacterized protein n=1 Tax=Musa balbisiana TaxID=52838 RepID=A0A4S8J1I8_MUSBA|nr:hypothetical protein C4D60_Mb10t22560 [Musa balbisiana]